MRNTEVVAWVSLASLFLGCQARPSQVDVANDHETSRISVVDSKSGQEAAPIEPAAPKEPEIPRVEGPHRVAFDLLSNRPLMHRIDSTTSSVLIDANSLDFVRYIHGNHPNEWNLNVEMEGERGASINKKRIATVWAPAPVQGKGVIAARVYSPGKGNLKLSVNGAATEPQSVEKGWQDLEFISESLRGENSIQFEFSGMGRIANVLSGGGVSRLSIGQRGSTTEPFGLTEAQGTLSLLQGQGAMIHLWTLPDSKLEFGVKAGADCDLDFRWFSENEGGMKEEITTVSLKGSAFESFVKPPQTGEVMRLSFEASEACQSLEFSTLRLLVPGDAVARPEVPAPKRIVFWLIDTLRADYLPIHFETNVRAPNLQRLAAEGASFKLAYVQGNESKTSHASLFSGMYPSKHGVVGRGSLKPQHFILPEAMKAQGFRTLGNISNGYVSGPWGFEQGWDVYKNNIRQQLRIDGRTMAREGIEWSEANRDKPFFLYLGTIDPHVTYREHPDIIGYYDTEPYNGPFKRACYGEDLGKIKGGSLKVTERDKVRIINLYKNEIEFNDLAFGELRAGLEEKGLWEDTLVVVTSDHGDEFWEHGSVGHGHSVYQDQVHVPFIVYYPPLIPAGTVVEAGVDVLDMYPTIMDILKADRPKDLQGKSVLPLIFKEMGDYPEPSIATHYRRQYAMQMQDWKLYLRTGQYQIYDRRVDSLELVDVSAAHPLASRWLLDSMGWFRAYRTTWDKQSWGPASNLAPGFVNEVSQAKRD